MFWIVLSTHGSIARAWGCLGYSSQHPLRVRELPYHATALRACMHAFKNVRCVLIGSEAVERFGGRGICGWQCS